MSYWHSWPNAHAVNIATTEPQSTGRLGNSNIHNRLESNFSSTYTFTARKITFVIRAARKTPKKYDLVATNFPEKRWKIWANLRLFHLHKSMRILLLLCHYDSLIYIDIRYSYTAIINHGNLLIRSLNDTWLTKYIE